MKKRRRLVSFDPNHVTLAQSIAIAAVLLPIYGCMVALMIRYPAFREFVFVLGPLAMLATAILARR